MIDPSSPGVWGLRFLWNHYSVKQTFFPAEQSTWIDQFFFCLLGGYSITFELNQSAFNVLKKKGYFQPDLDWDYPDHIICQLEDELSIPQFNPKRKKDGDYRSYRFPMTKAKVIGQAGRWLKESCNFEINKLLRDNSRKSRELFLECPGVGYKTASWFLRNIGFGQDLAILDVHICRILKEFQIIPFKFNIPTDYLTIEELFRETCSEIGARVDSMDLILWEWSRGRKSDRTRYQ